MYPVVKCFPIWEKLGGLGLLFNLLCVTEIILIGWRLSFNLVNPILGSMRHR